MDVVIERISQGETLKAVCRDIAKISESTIRLWVVNDAPKGISARYARAREAQAEAWADDIIDLADETSRDTIERQDGTETANSEWITRSRLRVDTRKWLMAKLHPKQYGDKLEQKIEHGVTDDLAKLMQRIRSRGA